MDKRKITIEGYSEEEIRSIVEYSRKMVDPTPEEREESRIAFEKSQQQFKARRYTTRVQIQREYAQMAAKRKKKLRFFGIGWWFE